MDKDVKLLERSGDWVVIRNKVDGKLCERAIPLQDIREVVRFEYGEDFETYEGCAIRLRDKPDFEDIVVRLPLAEAIKALSNHKVTTQHPSPPPFPDGSIVYCPPAESIRLRQELDQTTKRMLE